MNPFLLITGFGILLWIFSNPTKPATPPALNPADYAGDAASMIKAAMQQVALELAQAGQMAAARVYAEQSANPPPGTAARALERVADEFFPTAPAISAKLRALAAAIYVSPPKGNNP